MHVYISIYTLFCWQIPLQHICYILLPPPPCSTALLFIDTKAYQQHMRIRIANSRQVASLDLAAAHMQADNSGLFPTA